MARTKPTVPDSEDPIIPDTPDGDNPETSEDSAAPETPVAPKKVRGEFARERVQGNMFLVRREPDDEEEFPELKDPGAGPGVPGRYKVTRTIAGVKYEIMRTDY